MMETLKIQKSRGFALFEILLTAGLTVGLIFLLMQTQHNGVESAAIDSTGTHVAHAMDQILIHTQDLSASDEQTGDCPATSALNANPGITLDACLNNTSSGQVALSNGLEQTLKSQGIDPWQSTITITNPTDTSIHCRTVKITLKGTATYTALSTRALTTSIFHHLSADAVSDLCVSDTKPYSADDYKPTSPNTLTLTFSVQYIPPGSSS